MVALLIGRRGWESVLRRENFKTLTLVRFPNDYCPFCLEKKKKGLLLGIQNEK